MHRGLRIIEINEYHEGTPLCLAPCPLHESLAATAKQRGIIFHQLLPSANGYRLGPCVYAQDLELLRRIMRAVWGVAAATGC